MGVWLLGHLPHGRPEPATSKMKITRFSYTDQGTFGRFNLRGMTLVTVERPWLNNAPNVSCIPIGEYECKPRYYHRGGYDASQVCDVPGRSYILFHVGNYVRNSQGCILINSEHVYSKNGMHGISSRRAFNLFMDYYGNEPFQLTIENYNGGIMPEATN